MELYLCPPPPYMPSWLGQGQLQFYVVIFTADGPRPSRSTAVPLRLAVRGVVVTETATCFGLTTPKCPILQNFTDKIQSET
jgi:hypothetical protein